MASKNERRAKELGITLQAYKRSDEYKNKKKQRKADKELENRSKKLLEDAPDELKNDPSFRNLPLDMQEMALYSYKIQQEDNEDKARKMDEALNEATEQADPYWKNILRIAQDEIVRSFDEAKGDFGSSAERLNRRITEIQQDLVENKDFLSLEQQSELSQLSKTYEVQRDQLVETHALSGMTFSTKRERAETDLDEYTTGIVESTKRQYAKQMSDLEKEASRGNIEAITQLADLDRQLQEELTAIGRKAETQLGTENLPPEILSAMRKEETGEPLTEVERQLAYQGKVAMREQVGGVVGGAEAPTGETRKLQPMPMLGQSRLQKEPTKKRTFGDAEPTRMFQPIRPQKPTTGYVPLGGVTGSLYEDKARDIEQRKQAIYGEKVQKSLNY